jgi:hypothetical protein
MEIKGYTLHGDYYLADKVIPNKTWEEACEMKEEITLPNGKTIIAHTLSKEELESIPREERGTDSGWYWTSTSTGHKIVNYVDFSGRFITVYGDCFNVYGGVRLGFKNPF